MISPLRRIRIELAYDGTGFHGWQVQSGLATIQQALETILADMEGGPVPVAASGRTDAGVHALAQVAAFSLRNPIPVLNLRKALNRLLPPGIRINQVEEVDLHFHPRFDATAKTYEYRIFRGEIVSPFDQRYVYHYPYPLDVNRMIELAPILEGEHDFAAFAAADSKEAKRAQSKVRSVYSSRATLEGDYLRYRVRGSGFLKHMVRNIVGVLLEVGKGNFCDTDIRARLVPGCGIRPGPSAPACGLFLIHVEYGVEYDVEYNESRTIGANEDNHPD